MDRRTFLASVGASAVAPALPSVAQTYAGVDLAFKPDETIYRLLSIQRGLIREVHRVTGVPRYQLGSDGRERDTWMEQVESGLSKVITKEGRGDE